LIRLFAAIPLDEATRSQLSRLTGGLPGARWSPPENLHVTLRFVGEVDEAQAEAFHTALEQVSAAPFEMRVHGCGTFSSGHRTHTLWAGIEASEPLLRLQHRVEAAAQRAGLEAETRKYTPHITLARLSRETPPERLAELMAGNNLLDFRLAVDRFTLFVSHLGHGEPIYEPLAEYPLAD